MIRRKTMNKSIKLSEEVRDTLKSLDIPFWKYYFNKKFDHVEPFIALPFYLSSIYARIWFATILFTIGYAIDIYRHYKQHKSSRAMSRTILRMAQEAEDKEKKDDQENNS
jgi:hypothetical protein